MHKLIVAHSVLCIGIMRRDTEHYARDGGSDLALRKFAHARWALRGARYMVDIAPNPLSNTVNVHGPGASPHGIDHPIGS
jgi:hypothetical protein